MISAFTSLEQAYGDRFSAPQALLDRVQNGNLGLKAGGGFTGIEPYDTDTLVRYRNHAYAALGQVKTDLGPVPGQVPTP